MPRQIRTKVLSDGAYAHVYSRSLDKRFIFSDDEDFHIFRRLLLKTKTHGHYRVHHYCIMSTHFHMVVTIDNLTGFSRDLKYLKQTYANQYHEKYKKPGTVWWGRFGSQLIENEKYLYACGLYVEMNPVKAGMVSKAEDWPHSSNRHYFLGKEDELVDQYKRSSYDVAVELTEGLNIGHGSYIGTPLFLLNRGALRPDPMGV